MNKTNKIWIWLVVLLVVLNLTTVGTILYHHWKEREDDRVTVLSEEGEVRLTGRYFRQTLGFNDRQMEAFRLANREFQPQAARLIIRMDSIKIEMFKELNNAQPDSTKLNYLSELLGRQHAELKKITNRFYLNMKSVCDSSQCAQLQQLFLPLYYDENIHSRRGYRHIRADSTGINSGYRRQYGRNPQP